MQLETTIEGLHWKKSFTGTMSSLPRFVDVSIADPDHRTRMCQDSPPLRWYNSNTTSLPLLDLRINFSGEIQSSSLTSQATPSSKLGGIQEGTIWNHRERRCAYIGPDLPQR